MDVKFCYIKEEFFTKNSGFINMLDAGSSVKQSHRTHLCIQVESHNGKYYIPLRNNLGDEIRKFGRVGHAVPSQSREKAGLDYRYALLIDDDSYIEWQSERKIPKAQYNKIEKEFNTIRNEFEVYLNGYIKAAKKRRIDREPLYRASSLRNFTI